MSLVRLPPRGQVERFKCKKCGKVFEFNTDLEEDGYMIIILDTYRAGLLSCDCDERGKR